MQREREMKEIILEEICSSIDEIIESFCSEKVRIKFEKDLYQRVLSKVIAKHPMYHLEITRRLVYKLARTLEPLEVDPDKPRDFITYKSKWKKFRKRLKNTGYRL